MEYTLEQLARLPPEELSNISTERIFRAAELASPEERERVLEMNAKREIASERKQDYASLKLRGHYGSHSS